MKNFLFYNTSKSGFSFQGDLLETIQTPYQKIDIIKTPDMGIMLCLDDYIMVTQVDEHQYHELIVHPSCILLKKYENALIIGGGDGFCCKEVIKYPFDNIIQIEIDEMVSKISQKYFHKELGSTFDNPIVKFLFQDALAFFPSKIKFDYISLDLNDPVQEGMHSHPLYSLEFYKKCSDSLNYDGFLAVQIGCPYTFNKHFTQNLQWLREIFPFVEVYGQYMRCYGTYQYFAKCSFQKMDINNEQIKQKMINFNLLNLKLYNPEYYKGLTQHSNEILNIIRDIK